MIDNTALVKSSHFNTISFLGHLLSGSILNHLMHSKDAECILMFLSAMPRGVSVAHIYVLKLPLHHL